MPSEAAPRVVLLLPVAVLLHQLEEWFGGFVPWINQAFGDRLTAEQFLAVNATGLAIFTVGAIAAVSLPGAAWLAVSVATLLGVNGVAHLVGSLLFGSYSPGAVTGLLLFVPLSAVVLRSLARQLARPVFAGAVLLGVLFHLLATSIALS